VGYRPLLLCDAKEGYFVASEDIAFMSLNVNEIVEIMPGEGVEITENGYKIAKYQEQKKERKCVFEHIYFSHPASNIFGRNVYASRVELGKILAKSDNVEADIVVPVVDSGMAAAIGYSQHSGIPLHMGLLRNHWVGRSFIAPTQESRIHKVREKLVAIKPVVDGKRIVLIDDSLVRGTTSKEIINMLRQAGAKEIHFRPASPMILNTCLWGVDIPTREELIAVKFVSEASIAAEIGADSIKYLSLAKLKETFDEETWCYKCFEEKREKSEEKAKKEEAVLK
jgi:amidophosphoribosyltransferase